MTRRAEDLDDWATYYEQAADSATHPPQRASLEDTAAVLRRIGAEMREIPPADPDEGYHQHRARILDDSDEHAQEAG